MTTIKVASSIASNNCPGQVRRSRRGSSICTTQYADGSSEATEVQWEFQKGSWIYYNMQAIYMYKDKGDSSGRTDLMDAVIHTGRISGHLEEECVRRSGGRTIRI